jgi:SAM dependent carboxyl methyltransferase
MTPHAKIPPAARSVMAGAGYYNIHSQVQGSTASLLIEAFNEAARLIPAAHQGKPVVIVDYGCSEGRNSMGPMQSAAAILRARSPDQPILIIHTDQAGNDFASLFDLLQNSSESYLNQAATYGLAVGRSFYQQILPNAFVDLGWSAHAVHWLSQAPQAHATSFWTLWLEGSFAQAMAEQATRDWHQFLACRARELAPGARLLIIAFLRDKDGHIGVEGILKLMDQALSEMVADGSLSAAELGSMVLPTYFRSEAEFRAPFNDPDLSSVLILEHFQGVRQLDPFRSANQKGELGKAVAGFVRGFAEPFFKSRLNPEHAPFADRITDRLFSKLATLVSNSGDLNTTTNMALLTIRRAPTGPASQS